MVGKRRPLVDDVETEKVGRRRPRPRVGLKVNRCKQRLETRGEGWVQRLRAARRVCLRLRVISTHTRGYPGIYDWGSTTVIDAWAVPLSPTVGRTGTPTSRVWVSPRSVLGTRVAEGKEIRRKWTKPSAYVLCVLK